MALRNSCGLCLNIAGANLFFRLLGVVIAKIKQAVHII
jgi:hypothetical protein